uniref:Uncharacterized protein n=1 Tax=Oncorhynchus tshawytscha TaxID=74940 RepID=A0AAZ3SFJ0_ONCTS
MKLSSGKILEENLLQSCFTPDTGEEFPFQQDNNLQHKTKSTIELLTKKTVNVPEWPIHSFDLNLFENLLQDLEIAV